MLKIAMSVSEKMNRKQVFELTHEVLGVTMLTELTKDDEHPPSNMRTIGCALIEENLPVWIRKAS
jgi:hypothetical protein